MHIELISSNAIRLVLSSGAAFVLRDRDELGLLVHLPTKQAGIDRISVGDDSCPRMQIGEFYSIALNVVKGE